jgi:hypothetical protein
MHLAISRKDCVRPLKGLQNSIRVSVKLYHADVVIVVGSLPRNVIINGKTSN